MAKLLTASPQDFVIISGVRTLSQQQELVFRKRSKTLRSKHRLHQTPDGIYGLAVDIWPRSTIPNKTPFEFNSTLFYLLTSIAIEAQKLATTLNIPIVWGGTFHHLDENKFPDLLANLNSRLKAKRFVDAPHFELYVPNSTISD